MTPVTKTAVDWQTFFASFRGANLQAEHGERAPEPARYEADELRDYLQMEIDLAGGVRAWGRANGYDAANVCGILRGRIKMPRRVAKILGFRPVVLYEREEEEESE